MRQCVIELRGPKLEQDFSLLIFRFGQRIRLQLQRHQLPDPLVTTDPNTGESMARFYLHVSKQEEKNVRLVCQHFSQQSRLRVSCQLEPGQ